MNNTWKETYGSMPIVFSKHAKERAKESQMSVRDAVISLVHAVKEPFKLRHNRRREEDDIVYIDGTIHYIGKVRKDKYADREIFFVITMMDTKVTLKVHQPLFYR